MAVRQLSKSSILTGQKFNRLNQFAPLINFLIIGGGGGGGKWGAGGGAGGYRCSVTGELSGGNFPAESKLPLATGISYNVTVGAGGAGQTSTEGQKGASGNPSAFDIITSVAGGAGAGRDVIGTDGGSGGGSFTSTFNIGIAGQGKNGGTGSNSGGGGGGASVDGSNFPSTSNGGAGGNGLTSSITGTSVTRAGGGGGGAYDNAGGNAGAGGTGGGGGGSRSNAAAGNATANTGSGGGGGGFNSPNGSGNGGNGGSGIVILSYPAIYTITIGAGLTGSTATVGANKVTTLTAGTGNVSWAA